MPEWVCLLRAINLGARNKVNMPALRVALADAGMRNVRTYLQSGNVVLESDLADPEQLALAVRKTVEGCSGVDTPVIIRTPAEMREVVAWDPYPGAAARDPRLVTIVHLQKAPDGEAIARATGVDWGRDVLQVRGREAAICYAESMHQSRLQYQRLLTLLGVDGTARNWRTELAIADLLS
ncbi:MAG: DUF1697 domain-containing protein [Actinomycetales bacterium]